MRAEFRPVTAEGRSGIFHNPIAGYRINKAEQRGIVAHMVHFRPFDAVCSELFSGPASLSSSKKSEVTRKFSPPR